MDVSPKYISPCLLLDQWVFPSQEKLQEEKLASFILIYQNKPFVNPNEPLPNDKIGVYDLSSFSRQDIPISEAEGIPTLRDNYIGMIEVHWV